MTENARIPAPMFPNFPTYEAYTKEKFKQRSAVQQTQWVLRRQLGNLSRLHWHLEQQILSTKSDLRRGMYLRAIEAVQLDVEAARSEMETLPSKWKTRALAYAVAQGLVFPKWEMPHPASSFAERPLSGGGNSPPDLSRSDQPG